MKRSFFFIAAFVVLSGWVFSEAFSGKIVNNALKAFLFAIVLQISGSILRALIELLYKLFGDNKKAAHLTAIALTVTFILFALFCFKFVLTTQKRTSPPHPPKPPKVQPQKKKSVYLKSSSPKKSEAKKSRRCK